jgi:hypothetical protein
MARFGLPLNDNRKSAEKLSKKIMQSIFALKFWNLHHHGVCTFFCKIYFPFFKNGHFYFSKNVQNRKPRMNLELPFLGVLTDYQKIQSFYLYIFNIRCNIYIFVRFSILYIRESKKVVYRRIIIIV